MNYQLFIDPLQFSPDLASSLMTAIRATLGNAIGDAFIVHDVAISIREILDNVCRHADWKAERAPVLKVWHEELGDVPMLNIYTSNAIKPEADLNALREEVKTLLDPKWAQQALENRLVMVSPSSESMRAEVGGLGLLQIATLERSHLYVGIADGRFEVNLQLKLSQATP